MTESMLEAKRDKILASLQPKTYFQTTENTAYSSSEPRFVNPLPRAVAGTIVLGSGPSRTGIRPRAQWTAVLE
jgi:hypothetical protein